MQPYIFNGHLQGSEKGFDVHVACASKSSLFIRSLNGHKPRHGDSYELLNIRFADRDIKLGKCRFISGMKSPFFDGKLIFTDDIYDLYETLENGKVANLETHFRHLPIILLQKQRIKPEFKDYTSNLIYDLNAYKSFFDKIDAEYRAEEKATYEQIQAIAIEKEGRNFFEFFNTRLFELENLVAHFAYDEHQMHGYFFRRQLWGIISHSIFMLRTNLKPRGYSGDSETLNLVYDNEYVGQTIFEKLMHKHPLESAAACAVRSRRKIVSSQLGKIGRTHQENKSKFRVLSVACGSAREIEDILTNEVDVKNFSFTFLDQDTEALGEAEDNIIKRQKYLGTNIEYSLFPQSVRTLIRFKDLASQTGKFDFIYSLGLYDYLTDRIAGPLTKTLFDLLTPGGILLIGNYHISNPTRIYMEYWMDWVLYYRNEQEFLALAEDLPAASKDISFEDAGCQMFLSIRKGG